MYKSRRQFIKTIGLSSISLMPVISLNNYYNSSQDISEISNELVREFVRVAHFDFDETVKMLEKTPHLLNASQDWGDGDFESAIGAAGHMGFKELALFLINKGARFDIFVLTMLGNIEIVKPWIEAYPNLLNSIGPHGFTLLHHAEKGGSESSELFNYIYNKGLTKKFVPTFKKQ